MSTRPEVAHPDIELVRESHVMCFQDEYSAAVPGRVDYNQPFNFMGLPIMVQRQIFTLWLFKERQLIHCFSRLDSFKCPNSFPSPEELGPKRSGLEHLFFYGNVDSRNAVSLKTAATRTTYSASSSSASIFTSLEPIAFMAQTRLLSLAWASSTASARVSDSPVSRVFKT